MNEHLDKIFDKHKCNQDFGSHGMSIESLEGDLYKHIKALEAENKGLKVIEQIKKNFDRHCRDRGITWNEEMMQCLEFAILDQLEILPLKADKKYSPGDGSDLRAPSSKEAGK